MRKVVKAISLLMTGVMILSFGACGKDSEKNESSKLASSNESSEETTGKEDVVVIDVKDYGKITVKLDEKTAPITVKNFRKLVKDGSYDGLTFHRIISGFMIQGGCPNGDGTGSIGDTIKGEFQQNGVENNLSHKRGVISMARSQDPDSASSQFFIVHEDSQFLDGQYAAFGEVTDGMDVVDKICEKVKPSDGNGTVPKKKQPVITSIKFKE